MVCPIIPSQFAPPIMVIMSGLMALSFFNSANDAQFCWKVEVQPTILGFIARILTAKSSIKVSACSRIPTVRRRRAVRSLHVPSQGDARRSVVRRQRPFSSALIPPTRPEHQFGEPFRPGLNPRNPRSTSRAPFAQSILTDSYSIATLQVGNLY